MAIGKGPLMLSAFTVSLRSATKILDWGTRGADAWHIGEAPPKSRASPRPDHRG
jgi:hypothetical protein